MLGSVSSSHQDPTESETPFLIHQKISEDEEEEGETRSYLDAKSSISKILSLQTEKLKSGGEKTVLRKEDFLKDNECLKTCYSRILSFEKKRNELIKKVVFGEKRELRRSRNKCIKLAKMLSESKRTMKRKVRDVRGVVEVLMKEVGEKKERMKRVVKSKRDLEKRIREQLKVIKYKNEVLKEQEKESKKILFGYKEKSYDLDISLKETRLRLKKTIKQLSQVEKNHSTASEDLKIQKLQNEEIGNKLELVKEQRNAVREEFLSFKDSTKVEMQKMTITKDGLVKKLNHEESVNVQLLEDNANLKKEGEKIGKTSATKIKQLKEENGRLLEKMKTMETEFSKKLRKKEEQHSVIFCEVREQQHASEIAKDNQIEEGKNANKTLVSTIEAKELRIKENLKQIQNYRNKVRMLNGKVEELDSTVKDLELKNKVGTKNLQEVIFKLEGELKSSRTTCTNLKDGNEVLKKKQKELIDKNAGMQEYIDDLAKTSCIMGKVKQFEYKKV